MQNTEQERQSGLKLIVILGYILLLVGLNIYGADKEIPVNTDDPNGVMKLKISQAIGVFVIFICPAILFSLFWTKAKARYTGIFTRPLLLTLLLAGLGMMFAMPLINWLAVLNQKMTLPEAFKGLEMWMQESEARLAELTEVYSKGTTVGVLLLNLFVMAFMAALAEEFFFRGILQKVTIEFTKNKHIGVWFAAIIFSAFHLQFYGFVPRMLMGAFLGYLFVWSGSLWPAILAHFVNNGIAVTVFWLADRGAVSADADKIGIQPGEWVYVVVCAIIVALCLFAVYYIEKRRKRMAEAIAVPPAITDSAEV